MLTEMNLQSCEHLLVIYYTPNGTRYRFQRLKEPLSSYTVPMLKSAFHVFTEPSQHKLFAVNATIHDHVYTINAIEFNVVGNEIFTPTFNLWLCRHYLHIPPSETVDISYIDHTMSVCYTKEAINIDEDSLRIGNGDETTCDETTCDETTCDETTCDETTCDAPSFSQPIACPVLETVAEEN
jgi:hypothetical protein